MTDHQFVKSVFLQALELPEEARAAFVAQACGERPGLIPDVLALLDHAQPGVPLLDRVVAIAHSPLTRASSRFAPGTTVADRYALERTLGEGGMGEVFLAHDALLGGRVALKVLGAQAKLSPHAVGALLDEARAARSIVDPHVCRVFDVGLHEGEPYLAMEYVPGTDLAHVLAGEGRLDAPRARALALQLARALAAIHARGLLHRDLKPANVLIDGEGNARVTDFGLAAPIAAASDPALLGGTPGYVAPEVLAGAEPGVASDLFALGVVLFEAVTGRRAFLNHASVRVFGETRHEPPSPAHFGIETDPVLERVIAACLDPDPARRPASAAAVAAALAIDDPLTAVVGLGQHPSPRVIAASQARGYIPPSGAPRAALAVVLAIAGLLMLHASTLSADRAGLARSPAELSTRAREILASVDANAGESGHRFAGYSALEGVREPGGLYPRGIADPGSDVFFWYRESNVALVNWDILAVVTKGGRVTESQPPLTEFGSAAIWIDPRTSRLMLMQIAPPPLLEPRSDGPPAEVERAFAALFEHAGLDAARFTQTEPLVALATSCSSRWSWRGREGTREVVVEAGTLGERPCLFAVFERAPASAGQSAAVAREETAFHVVYLASPLLLVVALGLGWSHLRAGRGDPWGAFGLAVFVFATLGVGHLLQTDYPSQPTFAALFAIGGLSGPLLGALGAFVLYMAFEPSAQRLWPRSLVSWSRWLQGRRRDPLVAAHVVIGVLVSVAMEILVRVTVAIDALGARQSLPIPHAPQDALPGLRHGLALLLNAPFEGLFLALLWLALLVVLRLVVRRASWAIVAAVVVIALPTVALAERPLSTLAFAAVVQAAAAVAVLVRFGLLPCAVMQSCTFVLANVPLTVALGTWYAPASALAVGAVAILGLGAAWVAGHPRSAA